MEAPRGAREPTGTNGPTPHQPPQARHPPPQTASTATKRGGPGTASPTHRTGANTGGTGNQTPPTPAGPTNTGQDTATKRGGTEEPQPLYEPRPTHPPPRHTAGQQKGGGRHNLVVVTAPGKRPATFRTWKLSPAAPMVLHPRGCGRVGNRHNTPPRGGRAHKRGPPTHTHTPNQPTHARARDHARNNAHAPPRATTRTHASAHKRHPAGDNTRTPQTSTHTPTPATTRTRPRTRASYCARLPSNLRSFMFQQSSGR